MCGHSSVTATVIWPVSEVTVPTGKFVAPITAVLSKTFGSQLVMLIGIGATKSLTSELNASEDRLFTYAAPKLKHPDPTMPVSCRLIVRSLTHHTRGP